MLSSFYELSTGRPVGMSVGAISWRDIRDYADDLQLSWGSRRIFRQMMRELDIAFLAEVAARDNETEDSSPTPDLED